MKIANYKKLNKDDFGATYRDLIDKLGQNLTPYFEDINRALNNGINYDNLTRTFKTFNVTTTAGIPSTSLKIKHDLTDIKGVVCLSATPNTTGTLLTGGITINFTKTSGFITVNQITGLPDGQQFEIAVELIG